MTRHWIFVTSPKNFKTCKKYNVYGVDERYKKTVENHLETGDMGLFYIKKSTKLPTPLFVGPFTIGEDRQHNPDHPAVEEWDDRYEYIIPLRFEPELKFCWLSDVFDELLFLTNRKKGGGGFSDHFQFSIISIREEDYNTITSYMRKPSIQEELRGEKQLEKLEILEISETNHKTLKEEMSLIKNLLENG